MSEGAERWRRACLALTLLAVDPAGLRGVHLRARSGPVRETMIAGLAGLPLPMVRLHHAMPPEALYGGTDIAATMSAGRLVRSAGLLHKPCLAFLAGAERWTAAQSAQLLQALKDQPGHGLALMDEGATAEERPVAALTDWVAFPIDLEGIGRLEAAPFHLSDIRPAQQRLAQSRAQDDDIARLVTVAAAFGVHSLTAVYRALRAAMAHAAYSGRDALTEADITVAAELVLAPRATRLPEDPPDPQPEEAPPEPAPDKHATESQGDSVDLPEAVMIEAVRAALPAGLLERLPLAPPRKTAKGAGDGAKRKGNRRGRPLPSRPGSLASGARVDLIGTLRAAVPWQTLRRRGTGPVRILRSDIRVKRYETRSDRLLVFAVDASGSSALARLGEAKGAVEYLLAEAYARRDHVALIAFRGQGAELLLPPTRALVQAKRRLAGLPGGGGTPLAAGLKAAGDLATHASAQGFTPVLAVLTDGRANVALDGSTNRDAAKTDAEQIAHWVNRAGFSSLVIDAGVRPDRRLGQLAAMMGAAYLPMPRANAERLSAELSDALGA